MMMVTMMTMFVRKLLLSEVGTLTFTPGHALLFSSPSMMMMMMMMMMITMMMMMMVSKHIFASNRNTIVKPIRYWHQQIGNMNTT